jgi:cell division protease FtsH
MCLLVVCILVAGIGKVKKHFENPEWTYNKFVSMVEKKEVKSVKVQEGKLLVTTKKDRNKTYTVTMVGDENGLNELLKGKGIEYSKSPAGIGSEILSVVISIVLPLIVLFIGMFMIMKMMGKGGGPLGVGKNRAKTYVQKETGITFADVAGEEEAKDSLKEVVDFLHTPEKYTTIGAKLPKGALLVGPPAQERLSWQRQWPARRMCPFSPFPARNLWRCLWASAHPESGIFLKRRKNRHPASFLSMRSTPSERPETPATGEMTSGNRL